LKIVLGVIGSLGGGGAIVLGLSGWLGKVWAERLMEKERHEHAKVLESDRAKYGKELEELKAKYEHTHRRLQAELDKTIFGHQLKTQTEFNALRELWKTVPPLENALLWIRALSFGSEVPKSYLDHLSETKNNLQSVLSDYGPFVDVRIYETLQKMVSVADKERIKTIWSVPAVPNEEGRLVPLSNLSGADEFGDLRRQVFKAIADRTEELSQYDHPPGPADR
jgi:hypothetical protein